jgi:hypothetical protein
MCIFWEETIEKLEIWIAEYGLPIADCARPPRLSARDGGRAQSEISHLLLLH